MNRKIFFILILSIYGLNTLANVAVPTLYSRVTDQTNTLSDYRIMQLENKLKQLEDSTGSQIVVVMIPTTGSETIEQYSMRLAEQWKIGRKGVDDGVILLIAKDDRKLRIEVGYGFEGALPDAVASRIINELITPKFKNGDFAGGIEAGTDALIQIAYGEELPPPASGDGGGFGFLDFLLVVGIIAALVGGIILIVKFKYITISSFVVITFVYSWIEEDLASAFMIALGVLFQCIVVLAMFSGKSGGSYGSSSGGSYSSSGGGSSFSGGGGSFGGGGASGSW